MKRFSTVCLLALALDGCGSDAPEIRPPELLSAPSTFGGAQPVALDDSIRPPVVAATDSATTTSPPTDRCDPNYSPCVPIDSDVDCEGGRGNGPSYVRGPVKVVRTDVYGLDRDGDGTGCDRRSSRRR